MFRKKIRVRRIKRKQKKKTTESTPAPPRPHKLPTRFDPSPDTMYPDGGGQPMRGNWVQMDGGGTSFEEETFPDGGQSGQDIRA